MRAQRATLGGAAGSVFDCFCFLSKMNNTEHVINIAAIEITNLILVSNNSSGDVNINVSPFLITLESRVQKYSSIC